MSDTLDVVISDTVGFIRKLPHQLVEAFKATLEELEYADLLLHVIDISDPHWLEQAQIVDELIEELGRAANSLPARLQQVRPLLRRYPPARGGQRQHQRQDRRGRG